MEPDALAQVLCQLPEFYDPNLLVGFETSDDAAVYQISDSHAMIQTVDIFPPIVDDPFLYGQIAAANSLSDVYAMGGQPKLAMNIVCMPETLDKEIILEILQGGYSKCKEASAVICGGHTIKNPEPIYGLCVTGFIEKARILRNSSAKPGDVLILTKTLGTGVLNTALKGDLISASTEKALYESMRTLNKQAAEIMRGYDVHSCTDVTGFGLLGHAREMAIGSGLSIVIDAKSVPLLPQAFEMAEMGIVPQGAYKNRDWLSCSVRVGEDVPLAITDIMFDPQTSGGLLIALPEKEASHLLADLRACIPVSAIIGYAEPAGISSLIVK